MRLRVILSLITLSVMVLAVGSVGAETKPFKMTISGSSGFPLRMLESDEGQMEEVGMGICGGHSNLGGGTYICTTSGFWSREYVGNDTARCPGGREFVRTYAESSHIVRFANGEVLSMVPKFEPDYYNNYYCIYFCDPADQDCPMMGFYGMDYRTWEIIGGSGPFQGATGEASWEVRVDPVPYVGGDVQWAIHPSPFNGYITLVKEE